MKTNSKLTIYHNAGRDTTTRNVIWTRYNYNYAWIFGGKGSSTNKGYDNANDVDVRIPYDQNSNLDISKFSIGDIIVPGEILTDISKQQDLNGTLIYNITSINDNNFGNNKHIHLGGK